MSTDTPLMHELVSAMRRKDAVFYAQNSFSLSQSSMAAEMPVSKVLEQFKPLLSAEEHAELAAFYKAQARAGEIVSGLARRTSEKLREQAEAALAAHATPRGTGVYAFHDKSRHETVEVFVRGFDSCYLTRDGEIAGSLRVSPRGPHATEPWSFWIEKGRIVVRSDDDLF